jgi:hypothetical protein
MTRAPDLVCLSHLRWDSVYQRPQHLMTRFARNGRVFFLNEVQETDQPPYVGLTWPSEQLVVATPMVPGGVGETERYAILRRLIDGLFRQYAIRDYVLWYYTPMALPCTRHLAEARAIVYDCMDERQASRTLRDSFGRWRRSSSPGPMSSSRGGGVCMRQSATNIATSMPFRAVST